MFYISDKRRRSLEAWRAAGFDMADGPAVNAGRQIISRLGLRRVKWLTLIQG
jgi:hypothetical protein